MQIQRRQPVVGAVQVCQCRVLVQGQRRQLIGRAMQLLQIRVGTQIQRGQPVVGALQGGQCRIPAQIQRRQLVVGTVQLRQDRVLAQIQCRQLVVRTVQPGQQRVPAQLQRRQMVVAAVQKLQLRVPAQVQLRHLVVAAVQLLQGRELFDAPQRGQGPGLRLAARDVDPGDRGKLPGGDMLRIGEVFPLLKQLRKGGIKERGELRLVVQTALGDSQSQLPAAVRHIDVGLAGALLRIHEGRQLDRPLAGRAPLRSHRQPIRRRSAGGNRQAPVDVDREGN